MSAEMSKKSCDAERVESRRKKKKKKPSKIKVKERFNTCLMTVVERVSSVF